MTLLCGVPVLGGGALCLAGGGAVGMYHSEAAWPSMMTPSDLKIPWKGQKNVQFIDEGKSVTAGMWVRDGSVVCLGRFEPILQD